MKRTIAIFVGVLLAVYGYGQVRWVEVDLQNLSAGDSTWRLRSERWLHGEIRAIDSSYGRGTVVKFENGWLMLALGASIAAASVVAPAKCAWPAFMARWFRASETPPESDLAHSDS
ncbi:MAG: hypothetical protein WC718_13455 [Phycisphaerales bacterium]|jgi:hypothetical protein